MSKLGVINGNEWIPLKVLEFSPFHTSLTDGNELLTDNEEWYNCIDYIV